MIPTKDVNKRHSIISKYDKGKDKVTFVARTLTQSQNFRVLAQSQELGLNQSDPQKAWDYLLNLFEMLFVDVIGMKSEKVQGEFGESVSKTWADKTLPLKLVAEIVDKALKINVIEESESKNSSAQSGLENTQADWTAQDVKKTKKAKH